MKGKAGSIIGAINYIFVNKILGILCSKIDPNDMKPIRKYHVIVFSCKGYLVFLLRCLRATLKHIKINPHDKETHWNTFYHDIGMSGAPYTHLGLF